MAIFAHGNKQRADFQLKGQRYTRSFNTRTEAQQWVETVKARVALGLPGDESVGAKTASMTLAQAFRTARLDWDRQRDGAGTTRNAEDVLTFLGGARTVASLTRGDHEALVEHYIDLDLSGATINRRLATLSRFISIAQEAGEAIALKVKRLPEGEGRVRFLTDLEEKYVLTDLRTHGLTDIAEFVAVAIDTGCRLSELLAAQARWVRLGVDGKYLLTIPAGVTKSGKTRTVPLTKRAAAILTTRAPGVDLWPTNWNKDSVGAAWRACRKRIGLEGDLEFVFHACRHTCATRLLEATGNLVLVKDWLGHSDIRTTTIYAKVVGNTLTAGVEALEVRTHAVA